MKLYFWLKSSRGTDVSTICVLSKKTSKEDIEWELEKWCNNFGAWHISESYCTYGYKQILSNTRFTAQDIRLEKNAKEYAKRESLKGLEKNLNFYGALSAVEEGKLYINRLAHVTAAILYRLRMK